MGFIFHTTIILRNPLFKCIFRHLYLLLQMRIQNRILNYLTRSETQTNLRTDLSSQLHVQHSREKQIPVFLVVRRVRLATAGMFLSGSGKVDFLFRGNLYILRMNY